MTIDDQPWFVAADVCKALGYKNPTEFVRGLGSDERTKKVLGSGPALNVISESGLYMATLRAQRANPLARVFQDHVTKEVLPSIRKTGSWIKAKRRLRLSLGHEAEQRMWGLFGKQSARVLPIR